MTILPQSKREREPDPIPYPEYKYLSGSAFLVNLTTPKKRSFRVNSAPKSRNHISNS